MLWHNRLGPNTDATSSGNDDADVHDDDGRYQLKEIIIIIRVRSK